MKRKKAAPLSLALVASLGAGMAARALFRRLREADLSDDVALVTGGSRGLGFLLAREFGKLGCRVAICARDDAELERARQSLSRHAPEVFAGRCDITNREEVDRFVREVTEHFGRVDILVNNAGIIQVGPVESMTLQDYEAAMGVMFWGVLYPTLAVLPQMRQRHAGWIVNITSIGGKISPPHLLPYSCAKFAAVGLSEGLRAELAGDGISVTTVVPGLMRTGSHLNAFFKGRAEREFAWFSLGASLPFISMDAERAARQIVRATRWRQAEVTLGLPAQLAARLHGVFPATTIHMLDLVNRFVLPAPNGPETGITRGLEAQDRLHSRVLAALTALGRSAARRFNELS